MPLRYDVARICLRDKRRKVIILTYDTKDEDHSLKFPGGRREAGDKDWIATAIREFYEETGIPLRRCQVRKKPLTWYQTSDKRRALVGLADVRLSARHLPLKPLPGHRSERPRPVSFDCIRKGKRIKKKIQHIGRKLLDGGYRTAA